MSAGGFRIPLRSRFEAIDRGSPTLRRTASTDDIHYYYEGSASSSDECEFTLSPRINRNSATLRRPYSSISDSDICTNRFLRFDIGSTSDEEVFTDDAKPARKDLTILPAFTPPGNSEEETGDEEIASPEGPLRSRSTTPSPRTQARVQSMAMARVAPTIDAQVLYPPTACIFVANLNQSYDDKTLEAHVAKGFRQYGTPHVKIKRDKNQMPYAFVQFTRDESAHRAVAEGRGMEILGRPCRTEMVNAGVTFIVCRKIGGAITRLEALGLLSRLGDIAKIQELDHAVQAKHKLPPAFLVSYAMYDAKRDVSRAFGHDHVYRVIPYDSRMAQISAEVAMTPTSPNDAIYRENLERDRRSAYFGNLPRSLKEDTLREMASTCGNVLGLKMHSSVVHNGGTTHFAFVEFDDVGAPQRAQHRFNGKNIDGYFIRVEQKRQKPPTTPHRFPYGDSGAHQLPFISQSLRARPAFLRPDTPAAATAQNALGFHESRYATVGTPIGHRRGIITHETYEPLPSADTFHVAHTSGHRGRTRRSHKRPANKVTSHENDVPSADVMAQLGTAPQGIEPCLLPETPYHQRDGRKVPQAHEEPQAYETSHARLAPTDPRTECAAAIVQQSPTPATPEMAQQSGSDGDEPTETTEKPDMTGAHQPQSMQAAVHTLPPEAPPFVPYVSAFGPQFHPGFGSYGYPPMSPYMASPMAPTHPGMPFNNYYNSFVDMYGNMVISPMHPMMAATGAPMESPTRASCHSVADSKTSEKPEESQDGLKDTAS